MNKTIKKNVLLTAVLTIMLCVSLIAGATFALFTSESSVNVAVTSGKVDVTATATNIELGSTLGSNVEQTKTSIKNNVVSLTNFIPGDYATFNIEIKNNSSVTVQYRTVIKKVEDDGLWENLDVTIDDAKFDGETIKTDWQMIEPSKGNATVSVKVEFPSVRENGQGKSCKFAYTVEALQGNATPSSEWDGETKTEPTKDTETGVYHITNANEFVSFITDVTAGGNYCHQTISLDADIDLCGQTIKTTAAQANRQIDGVKFDGNNHIISNFIIDSTANPNNYYGGLFGYMAGYHESYIKNLIVTNATVIGGKQSGVIIGGINGNNSTIENCKVYNSTVFGTKKVGAVVGYTASGIVKDCYAENCGVYCQENDMKEAAEVVGFINIVDAGQVDNTSNNTYKNVNVSFDCKYVADGVVLHSGVYEISNANGLQWFANQVNENYNGFNGNTIKLTADIDLNNAEWYPIGQGENINGKMQEFYGIFDGDGHTVKNLKIKSHTPEEIRSATNYSDDDSIAYGVGFFGWLSGAVKNVTFENVKVTGYNKVGVVAGYFQYTGDVIENCNVKNCEVLVKHIDDTFCGDKAGGIVGMIGSKNGAVKNCKVENTTITAGRDAGQVVGCAQSGTIVEGCTAINVTVTAGGDCTDANINNGIIGRDLRE